MRDALREESPAGMCVVEAGDGRSMWTGFVVAGRIMGVHGPS
jgi:hypothetical protein